MLIDAHIHLDQYKDHEISPLLVEAQHVIAVSNDLSSCKRTLALSRLYSKVNAAFGFHPEQLLFSPEAEATLFHWMRLHAEEMVAVGEVGLPYYLKQNQTISYAPYISLLERFIVFAKDLHKPIVLHAVYEDAVIACDLLEKHHITKAHFHWFKGSEEVIQRMIRNGYYISITPDCTYEPEIQQLIRLYPIELMMVETDGPWPFEGPFSNQKTSPRMMKHSIEMIAKLKGIPTPEAAHIVTRNTKAFYDL